MQRRAAAMMEIHANPAEDGRCISSQLEDDHSLPLLSVRHAGCYTTTAAEKASLHGYARLVDACLADPNATISPSGQSHVDNYSHSEFDFQLEVLKLT